MGTAVQNGALWGARAQEWSDLQEPNHTPLWRAMLEAANVRPGMHVLDVACGGGNLAGLARQLGAKVTGLDASEALCNVAASRVDGTFVAGEMEELPFVDGSFDVALIANGLQYAADRLQAARELKRVLKPQGVAVVGMWSESDKCEMDAVFATIRRVAPAPPGTAQPLDLSQRQTLLDLLRQAGFTIVTDGEVATPFEYENREAYWVAQRSAGVMEGAARRVGEDVLKAALLEAAKPFTRSDGRVVFQNMMRYVVAT